MPEDTRSARASQVEQKAKWPYTSFKSLLNLFERIEATKAVPAQIDRSVLGGSEGQKTQVMAALKFMGLVGENGTVTSRFREIVQSPKERPRLIRAILEERYPAQNQLGVEHGSTKQLEDTFTGLSSDTLRKAMTFYLHAAKYAQLPTSKFFKVPSGFNKPKRPRPINGGEATPLKPSINSHSPAPIGDMRARYLDMLMERAKASEALDVDLLDRIEKLLGYQEDGEENA